jgi:hypothetical protein
MPEPNMQDIAYRAVKDLMPHTDEFDAVVCAGDMHGAPIAGAIAALMNKPLMIVCMTGAHECAVSHIVTIGSCRPDHRYLYTDDFYEFGASRKVAFDYMNQSVRSPVVAAYAATKREYERITDDHS